MSIRVLLVDDQPLLRQGFSMILQAQPDLQVVGEAGDGHDAVRLASTLQPDIVLMDIRMPHLDGIRATRAITARAPTVRIILLTTFDVDEYAIEGLQAGASGFLLKNARTEELLSGIRAVAAGDAVLAPSTTRRLLNTYASTFTIGSPGDPSVQKGNPLSSLTPRERDVFFAMAEGMSNQEIAAALFLSETTVKTHVTRVLSKLELRDRIHAVIFAYRHQLTSQGHNE